MRLIYPLVCLILLATIIAVITDIGLCATSLLLYWICQNMSSLDKRGGAYFMRFEGNLYKTKLIFTLEKEKMIC